MANLTTAYENKVVDMITGVSSPLLPLMTYMALFSQDPTDAGDVTGEIGGAGYARVSLDGVFAASASGTAANTAKITFPQATASWGTITHVGIMESGTAGTADMMLWAALDVPVTIEAGGVFEIAVGDMDITAS